MITTWKPVLAGILGITAGSIRFLTMIIVAIIGGSGGGILNVIWPDAPEIIFIIFNIIGLLAIPLLLLSVVAIIGGIYALLRKTWIIAITGASCAILLFWFLGIPALVLTILSEKEFS